MTQTRSTTKCRELGMNQRMFEQQERSDPLPEGKIQPRDLLRAERARHAIHQARTSANHLEAAIMRSSTRVRVTVDGADASLLGGWVDICRAIARAYFDSMNYWEAKIRWYAEVPDDLKSRIEFLRVEFDQFAGDPG